MYQNGKNISFTDRSVGSVNSFLSSVSKSEPLTLEQEYALWLRMRQGDNQARDQLISANLRYVVAVAKRYVPSGTSLEDLIMAGCEGIVKAADKFDATRGFRFITFATWSIESEVRKAAYDHLRHNVASLDAPLSSDDEDSSTLGDLLEATSTNAPDWNLHYDDAVSQLSSHADKHLCGAGTLVAELHQMLQQGYAISDFARKHHLSERQLSHFLDMLRGESLHVFRQAA